MQGRFSLVAAGPGGGVILIRDKLGLNKLFFALHESGRVVAGNYLIDLVRQSVPVEAIFSVPAGHFVEIDGARRTLSLTRYFDCRMQRDSPSPSLANAAVNIRRDLEEWFTRLAGQFSSRRICLCLSGGLDSGLIAIFAKRYFPDLTAYTYVYDAQRGSEDARHAERLAEHLAIRWQPVSAARQDILDAVEAALIYGQDWRDFNVHCAIVNVILAKQISSEGPTGSEEAPLVLTGDLANEFLADYSPVFYDGREYYKLPRLDRTDLRLTLVRGLDAGDREIGVFNHFGLDVIQPYGFLVEHYLRLPVSLLYSERRKPALAREIVGDRLPLFLFDRPKVRAQIGHPGPPRAGILPVLIDSGRDSAWLKKTFCRLFGIGDERFLNQLIRAGLYRFTKQFPHQAGGGHGYYTG